MGLSHRRSGRWTAATAALAELPPGTAAAQELPDLTLEELMRVTIQRVFGASERLQPVTEAPASVTIVTADEIRPASEEHRFDSIGQNGRTARLGIRWTFGAPTR